MNISKNNVDLVFTSEAKAAVVANLDTLAESLELLTSVVPADRKRLVKLGDKSEGFVRQAHQVVRDHGQILPTGLTLEQMDRDVALREMLLPLQQRLSQMLSRVNDTYMLAGSDLMQASMIVYRCLKSHGSAVGLGDVTAALSRRFEGQGRRAPEEPVVPPVGTGGPVAPVA